MQILAYEVIKDKISVQEVLHYGSMKGNTYINMN